MNTLITILGPTASGKTRLAAEVAARLNGEIISADSRQVYRGMNLGTGKDYDDYTVNGKKIPYHLIDIANPGEEYNVFRYTLDAENALNYIYQKGKTAILCGGTGLYLEALLAGYKLDRVPLDQELRKSLEDNTQQELVETLKSLRPVHNTTDTLERERTLRAIEIARFELSEIASARISSVR
jgi:tRNA dimethylallyltransferase